MNQIPTPITDNLASTMFPDGSKWVMVEDCKNIERKLTAVTAQRDAAWQTIAEIRKDIVDDESFGKVVDTLFAEPLIEVQRKLTVAREALQEATDKCLWRSDSEFPLSKEESQRLYDIAILALSTTAP